MIEIRFRQMELRVSRSIFARQISTRATFERVFSSIFILSRQESNKTGTYFELFRGKAVNHSTNTLGSGRLDLTKLTKDELHDVVVDCRNEKNQIMGKVFFDFFLDQKL